MTKKLYVGNLSYDTTEGALSEMFGAVGTVQSVALINDRETGRSKGFAFVEMDDEAAAKAITELNGKDLDGRNITVAEARPREERSGGYSGGGRGGARGGGGRSGGGSRSGGTRDRW